MQTYDALADEYYDARSHPTCANFRACSRPLLSRWLLPNADQQTRIIELGAGKSIAAEILAEAGRPLSTLTVVDSSRRMIAHSYPWIEEGARLLVARAEQLPVLTGVADIVVSCLGDAYNDATVWTRMCEALGRGGKCLFTTPAYDWAVSFRESHDDEEMRTAEFTLLDGAKVRVPSVILPREEQVELFATCGFEVDQIVDVPLSAVPSTHRSPRLVLTRGPDANVVTGFSLSKKA